MSTNDMQIIGPRTLAIQARQYAEELEYYRTLVTAEGTQNVYGHADALRRVALFLRQLEAAADGVVLAREREIRGRLGR